jgi:hypothetical protein
MATRGRKTLSAIWLLTRHQDEDGRLTPPHKLLWVIYRSYEGKAGRGAFVGDDRLAGHLGKSVRSVQMYRADLVEWGYLKQQLRGPNPAMYWAVLPPELDAELPDDLRADAPEPDPKPAPTAPPPRRPRHNDYKPPHNGGNWIPGVHGPAAQPKGPRLRTAAEVREMFPDERPDAA